MNVLHLVLFFVNINRDEIFTTLGEGDDKGWNAYLKKLYKL